MARLTAVLPAAVRPGDGATVGIIRTGNKSALVNDKGIISSHLSSREVTWNEIVSVCLGIAAARGIAKIKMPNKVLKGAIVVIVIGKLSRI